MATNRDLLKEAIADAKAVKETAIANAKAALEEAFTPFLKEKLSAKLAEMETEDESMYEETEKVDEMKKMEDEAMTMDEVSLDELLAELDEESKMEDEAMYEAKGEEEEMSIEDMSEDDLKSFIEDVIKDMVAAGELEAGHEGEEAGEMEAGEEEEAGEEMELDEEFDINELLAELEVDEAYKKKATDPSPKSKNAIFNKNGDEYVTPGSQEDVPMISKEKATKTSFYEDDMDEVSYAPTVSGENAAIQAIANALDTTVEKVKANWKDLKGAFMNVAKAAGSATSTMKEEELEEAMSTIQTLRSELNEINLLNAKLLYTNKIFRNKSLNESQKVKVLTAFDKAASKKEVELVYETLLESLKVSTKAPIKESMGSASKVLGGTTSKPIIENDAFSRMRELAFGRNK